MGLCLDREKAIQRHLLSLSHLERMRLLKRVVHQYIILIWTRLFFALLFMVLLILISQLF